MIGNMKIYFVICEHPDGHKTAVEKQWDEYEYEISEIFYDRKTAVEVVESAVSCEYSKLCKYTIHEVVV